MLKMIKLIITKRHFQSKGLKCLKLSGSIWVPIKTCYKNYMAISNYIQLFIKKYKILEKFLKRWKNKNISSKSVKEEIRVKNRGVPLKLEELERMHPAPLKCLWTSATQTHGNCVTNTWEKYKSGHVRCSIAKVY